MSSIARKVQLKKALMAVAVSAILLDVLPALHSVPSALYPLYTVYQILCICHWAEYQLHDTLRLKAHV